MTEEPAIDRKASCGCHGRTTGDRLFTAALVVTGLAGIAAGTACLMWMNAPEIGINPFDRVEGGDFVQFFVSLRRMAFLTIAFGLVVFLAGVFIRPRWSRRKCAE